MNKCVGKYRNQVLLPEVSKWKLNPKHVIKYFPLIIPRFRLNYNRVSYVIFTLIPPDRPQNVLSPIFYISGRVFFLALGISELNSQ